MPTITKLYSWKEAAEHASNEDCWVVVDGKVYDVSKFLDEHPGGDDVLLKSAGKDATDEFEDAGHSKSAREIMTDYFIGEIDSSSVTIPELEIFKKEQQSPPSLKFLDRPLQFWALPVAFVSVSAVVGLLYLRKK